MKILVLLPCLFFPFLAFAQPILINEIAWMGSSVEGVDANQWWRYEWVELYNNADTVGMVDGWMLELYRDKLDFRIPLKGAIEPKGYFLIGASEKIKNLNLNYANLAGKFVNSGQKIVLKNSAGEIVDEVDPVRSEASNGVDATKGWPAGDNETKRTMERVAGTVPATWQTSRDSGGTPKAQNSSGAAAKLMAQKLSFPGKLSFNSKAVALKPSETKKDISMSSDEESQDLFNSTGLVALVLALGSSAAAVLLRRRLSRV
ncbi:MAG: hypothetical protein Greene071421_431 [Parcubacteria group bacterium Greene0714_21]|nr:MAG: hypothetical protein Greene041639_84 [Parcubacteria group bacterium Greene0416_39]TSC98196.1 MAG: hypothetical protein Greene101447_159 [Parcubacteria group bacterium Greene1014_47]TSD04065.1 MAG: hypothetical protein Greene071421_431 [Parcubacteria group bacterium Greene0714_21]